MMKEIIYKDAKLFVPERYMHDNLLNRFINKVYEKEEEAMIAKYIDENDVVLEVGSCIGYTTTMLSERAKSVTSVEANPELVETLNKMVEANELSNVEMTYGYLSDLKSQVDFQTYDNIVAGSGDRQDLEINNARGWGHTLRMYKVDCIKLKDLPGYSEFNAMCLDLEGGKLDFLTEYQEYITKNIKKIILEIHGHLMKDSKYNSKCFEILKQCGFEQVEMQGEVLYYKK